MTDLDTERYPVGRLVTHPPADAAERARLIDAIARLPSEIRALVTGLDARELDTSYRDGGWTIRQVVHHVPDSHMNAYVRVKLALTEPEPAIKTYEEARWAELPDSRGDVGVSLDLLDALHRRWVALLRSLSAADLARTFVHPEWGRISVDQSLRMYDWHGRHHTAHIRNALARAGRAVTR